MHLNKEHYYLLLLIIFSSLIPLGLIPLFDLDEGAFSEATREMLVSGNHITTYLNGELRFDKPILIYWLQLASVKVFGLNEFAVRFPSAISGILWLVSIYFFTKKYFNYNTAFKASIFMLSSIQIMLITKAAIADSLLNLFLTATMFALFEYFTTKEKKYLYLVFIFAAFGMLAKGPVAVLIPLVVGFIYGVFKKELPFYFKSLFNIKGIVLFLLIAAPWYIAEYLDQGKLFIDGFILKHNIGRFSSAMEHHSGSYFYFIPVILLGLVPFTSFFIKSFSKLKEDYKSDIGIFLWSWFIFVFLFFSFSNTKLPHYVIYGYTPLFILMARFDFKNKFMMFLPWIIFCILMIALYFFVPHLSTMLHDSFSQALLENRSFTIYFLIGFILFLIITAFLIKLDIEMNKMIFVVSLMSIIAFNYLLMPSLGKVLQQPVKELALYVKKNNLTPVIMGVNTPSFNFYSEKILETRDPKVGETAYTKINSFNRYNRDDFKIIKRIGAYLLVEKIK